MGTELHFVPLKSAPSAKALQAYHLDANWPASQQALQQTPRGVVRWVSVEVRSKQIAIARLELAPPEFCYVADLIVSSAWRGKGVGSWFMQRIEQYCNGLGIRRLILQAAHGTDAFYQAQRFAPDPYVPTMLKKDINPLLPKMFLPPGR